MKAALFTSDHILTTFVFRKEKAEMEALQATIEKLKVDHEAAAKKWKLAEARWVLLCPFFFYFS